MFELFTSVLLHLLISTGQPASIGGSGWGGGDVTGTPTSQTNGIGGSGWGGGDVTDPNAPGTGIGGSGWGGGD